MPWWRWGSNEFSSKRGPFRLGLNLSGIGSQSGGEFSSGFEDGRDPALF